jgi:hypothetical protein
MEHRKVSKRYKGRAVAKRPSDYNHKGGAMEVLLESGECPIRDQFTFWNVDEISQDHELFHSLALGVKGCRCGLDCLPSRIFLTKHHRSSTLCCVMAGLESTVGRVNNLWLITG